jgi:putative PIN family toxin of toxin-antitoxin system
MPGTPKGKKVQKIESVEPILRAVRGGAELVKPVQFLRQLCSDPDDDKFLEAAIAGQAHYVVTGDRALLAVQKVKGMLILEPAQLMRKLSKR